jgi:chloride channel protein, CIC family
MSVLSAKSKIPGETGHHPGDFTTNPRVLVIAGIAVIVATAGVLAGVGLLQLIKLATNIAYFGRFSVADVRLQDSPLGVWAVGVPVVGSLIIGLMARFGSEKIRGHGIPEAIEAILLGRSRLDAKVAILKPLSSARAPRLISGRRDQALSWAPGVERDILSSSAFISAATSAKSGVLR